MKRELELKQGEDLRAVALRELGSAARWPEIATLNGLRLPFVVQSRRAEDRLPGTLIWGDAFLIPARDSAPVSSSAATILGLDVAIERGDLVTDRGDVGCVSGTDTMQQAIRHRLQTLRGELVQHARYGSHISLALGLPAGPFASFTAAGWVYETLLEEPRIRTIEAVDARVAGDVLTVAARIVLVGQNTSVDFNAVLTP